MEEMIEQPIKVYVKLNNQGYITQVASSIFLKDTTGWVEIDRGFGDKYAHAQSQYFDKPLINEDGRYNYKYINGKVVEQVKNVHNYEEVLANAVNQESEQEGTQEEY